MLSILDEFLIAIFAFGIGVVIGIVRADFTIGKDFRRFSRTLVGRYTRAYVALLRRFIAVKLYQSDPIEFLRLTREACSRLADIAKMPSSEMATLTKQYADRYPTLFDLDPWGTAWREQDYLIDDDTPAKGKDLKAAYTDLLIYASLPHEQFGTKGGFRPAVSEWDVQGLEEYILRQRRSEGPEYY